VKVFRITLLWKPRTPLGNCIKSCSSAVNHCDQHLGSKMKLLFLFGNFLLNRIAGGQQRGSQYLMYGA
jgi:hypothetical protein